MHPTTRAPRRGLLVPLATAVLVAAPALGASAAGPATQEPDTPLTGAECLLGTWAVDEAAERAQIAQDLGDAVTDIDVTYAGSATMTFTEDTFTFAYDDEAITVEFTTDGHRYGRTGTSTGTRTAPYTADDSGIRPEPDLSNDVSYWESEATVDGSPVNLLPDHVPFAVAGLSGLNGPVDYECSGDELTFSAYDASPGTEAVVVLQQYTRLASPSPDEADPAEATPAQTTPRAAAPRAAAATPAVGSPAFTG